MEITELEEKIEAYQGLIQSIRDQYHQSIVGQENLLENMLISLLCSGHVLLEGVPGLAKTQAIKTLASLSGLDFSRIQFTPDLLPADLIGTQIYNQKTGEFSVKKGPVFTQVLLADEINRAPSKVQSALLEAMQEQQVTLADTTHPLPRPYFVLATQNPMEQEGTYPLPEAQLDRFLMKIKVEYPLKNEEVEIIRRESISDNKKVKAVLSAKKIAEMIQVVEQVYVDERLYTYVVDLVQASRQPEQFNLDANLIQYGASPRASIALLKAAKAYAFIQGDGFVKTDDIKAVAPEVLRHRIIPSFEAEAENVSNDDIIYSILSNVKTP